MNNFKNLILHELNGKVARNLKQLDKNNAERNAAIQYLANGNDVKTLRELPDDIVKSVLWRNPKLYDELSPEQQQSEVIQQAQQENQIRKDFDPKLIQQIENPSIELQNYIINKNPTFIKYINNPSFEAQRRVVSSNPSLVKYIKNPSNEIMEIAKSALHPLEIMKDMCKTGDIVRDLAIAAVSSDKKALKILLDSNLVGESTRTDSQILKAALAADPTAIEYLAENGLATPEYQRFAIEQNPDIIKMMPEYFYLDDLNLVQYARDQKRKLNDIRKKGRIKQIQDDPFIIDILKDVTPEEQELADSIKQKISNNVVPYALKITPSTSDALTDFIVDRIIGRQEKTPELRSACAHILSSKADDPEIKYQLLKKFPNIIGSIPDNQITPQDISLVKDYGGETVIEQFLLSNPHRNLPANIQKALVYDGNSLNHKILRILKTMDNFDHSLLYSDKDINAYKTDDNNQKSTHGYIGNEPNYNAKELKDYKDQKTSVIINEYDNVTIPLVKQFIQKLQEQKKLFTEQQKKSVDELFSKEKLSEFFNYNIENVTPDKLQIIQKQIDVVYNDRNKYYQQWVDKCNNIISDIMDEFVKVTDTKYDWVTVFTTRNGEMNSIGVIKDKNGKKNYDDQSKIISTIPDGAVKSKHKTIPLSFHMNEKTKNTYIHFLDVSSKQELDKRFNFIHDFLINIQQTIKTILRTQIRNLDILLEYPYSSIDLHEVERKIKQAQADEEERKRQYRNPSWDYIKKLMDNGEI